MSKQEAIKRAETQFEAKQGCHAVHSASRTGELVCKSNAYLINHSFVLFFMKTAVMLYLQNPAAHSMCTTRDAHMLSVGRTPPRLLRCCRVALAERRVWGDPTSGEGERHIHSPSKTQPVPLRSPGVRMSPSTTKILLCSIRWVDRVRGGRGWQTLIQNYFPLLNTLKI